MLKFKKYSLIVVLSLLFLHGQRSRDMEKFGFIDLKTDSMDVPFYIADATTLTESGYVGDDVESILASLIEQSGGDIERLSLIHI